MFNEFKTILRKNRITNNNIVSKIKDSLTKVNRDNLLSYFEKSLSSLYGF